MTEKHDNLVQIEWRLLNMMAERRIRTATALRQKLAELGVDISSQQLGRLINQFPERLNTTYLRGLLTALDCDISDLIVVHPPGENIGITTNANQVHPTTPTKKKATRSRKKGMTKKPPINKVLPPGFDE